MSNKYTIPVLVLFSLFGLFICSCQPYGCTDEYASNYEEDALEDDGTCEYPSRQIVFYTNNEFGGEIHVELSTSNNSAESYFYYGNEFPSSSFSYEGQSALNPSCGDPNLVTFERYTNQDYYYDAHDKYGNVWSGTVRAVPGECKMVELYRDPTQFGRIQIYSSAVSSSGVNVLADPQGNSYDEDRYVYMNMSNLYSATEPACGSLPNGFIYAKAGNIMVNIKSSFPRNIDRSISVQVPAQGCVSVDIAPYL